MTDMTDKTDLTICLCLIINCGLNATFSALALFLSHSNKLPIVKDDSLCPKVIVINRIAKKTEEWELIQVRQWSLVF